jgi:hypothetical protein
MSLSYKDGDGTYRLGGDRRVKKSELKAGESIVVVHTDEDGNESFLYTVHRPPRRKNESPIRYYKRTGCVDNRYYHRHNGLYYCNPAHCSGTWKSKRKRDEHLDMAYAILG